MSTTPPTAAEMDSWADANPPFGGENNMAWQLIGDASSYYSEGNTGSYTPQVFAVGYTQNDNTQQIILINDPTSDQASAQICWLYYYVYGAVLVREWAATFSSSVSVNGALSVTSWIADSTEQARINNTSNWVQFS